MKIDKSKVLIGSDFEMFLSDKNGKIISAIPFNDGTKKHPRKLDRIGCCIQRDGVLQECNIPPTDLEGASEFWDNIEYVKDYIRTSFANDAGLELLCCPSANLTEDQLQEDEARAFGCEPDYDAWRDAEMNEKDIPEGTTLRSCGGHLHLSYEGANIQTSIDLMKMFDTFLTIPFVLIDKDTERRKLYGKAGSFRLCNWGNAMGFEARTLSNKWLEDERYVDYIFHQLNAMIDYYNEYGVKEINTCADKIVEAINYSNDELAGEICEKFGILLLMEKDLV